MTEYKPGFDMDREPEMDYILGQYNRDNMIMPSGLWIAAYELDGPTMKMHDPVWGECKIGDEPYDDMLLQLARTDPFRRLQAVEQLTLGGNYATMPNSMALSRWQHIWGSVAFVRKMLEDRDDITPRDKMAMQLRTLLSDVGHTAFSHLGDWLFQDNGAEDLHDAELKQLLQLSGIEEIITKHGFNLDEVVFPEEKQDWIECPSPNLCVDRIDYGTREIMRWGDLPFGLHLMKLELQNPKTLFEIQPDGNIAIKNLDFARKFAAAFNILPTEHWAHPVHRLQLQLFQMATKMALIMDTQGISTHPRDALFKVDGEFEMFFQTWDLAHLNDLMKRIGSDQRRLFIQARHQDLENIFSDIRHHGGPFPEFPDPLEAYSWQSREMGKPYPASMLIKKVPTPDAPPEQIEVKNHSIKMYLPPLKARSIDPLVVTAEGTVPLSQIDASYADYLAGQKAMMGQAYEARVFMRSDTAQRILEQYHEAEGTWKELVMRERDPEQLMQIIGFSAMAGAGRRFDKISDW